VIALSLIHRFTVIGYYSLSSLLYLRRDSSNPDFTASVSKANLSPGSGEARRGARQRASFNVLKATSTTGINWKVCFFSVIFVSGFEMLAKPEINHT
jgi:hypothetical protein